jgi:predicted nucleic acid-binding Zn ribbon protein
MHKTKLNNMKDEEKQIKTVLLLIMIVFILMVTVMLLFPK